MPRQRSSKVRWTRSIKRKDIRVVVVGKEDIIKAELAKIYLRQRTDRDQKRQRGD